MNIQHIVGDIWHHAAAVAEVDKKRPYVVIPTSLCWKADGHAVMGRGLALQAAKREDGLARAYGTALINSCCRDAAGKLTRVFAARDDIFCWRWIGGKNNLLLLPTKPLNPDQPQLSWQNQASIALIERSLRAMHAFLLTDATAAKVLLPLLGEGNGQLKAQVVWMIYHRMFPTFDPQVAERIIVVERHGNTYNAS